jgi:hypothetical protein
MRDPRLVVVLMQMSQVHTRARTTLKDLQRRLKEELKRVEHARIVRIRHYLTVSCLPAPGVAPRAGRELSLRDKPVSVSLNEVPRSMRMSTASNIHRVVCRSSFERLLQRFEAFYWIPKYTPKGGRPRKLQHHHQVRGLLLAFYVGAMQHKSLCSIFGVPHSTLSRVLTEAEDALKSAFVGFPPARIVWPTLSCQRALARLTAARSALLPFTWGFIDGKNYRVTMAAGYNLSICWYHCWANVECIGACCRLLRGCFRYRNLLTGTSKMPTIMVGYTQCS